MYLQERAELRRGHQQHVKYLGESERVVEHLRANGGRFNLDDAALECHRRMPDEQTAPLSVELMVLYKRVRKVRARGARTPTARDR